MERQGPRSRTRPPASAGPPVVLRAAVVLAGLVAGPGGLVSGEVHAYVAGEDLGPEPALVLEGPFDVAVGAGSHLRCEGQVVERCSGLGGGTSFADVAGVPDGSTVERAFLVWTASQAAGAEPDRSVLLGLPQAAPEGVTARPDECEAFTDAVEPTGDLLGWFTCRADITALVTAHVARGLPMGGRYSFSDLEVESGLMYQLASVVVGGWSVVLFFRPPPPSANRNLYYYTGLQLVQAGSVSVEPGGFEVPAGSPRAQVILHVLEGDGNLRGDRLLFNNRPLSDACNPADNVFNDTINVGLTAGLPCITGAPAVDLDAFDVSGLVQPGQTSATVELEVPSEQVFTNYLVVAFDSVPRFLKPRKESVPASGSEVVPGQILEYRLRIVNDGDGPAVNVVVADAIPEGTAYVAETTCLDGRPVEDPVIGRSPLEEDGLALDARVGGPTLPGPEAGHTLAFQVRVLDGLPPGTRIANRAVIRADGIEAVSTNETAHRVTLGEPPPDLSHPCAGGAGGDAGAGDGGTQADGGEAVDGGGRQVDGGSPGGGDAAARPDGGGSGGGGTGGLRCGPGTHEERGVCLPDGTDPPSSSRRRDEGCSCRTAAGGDASPWNSLPLLALVLTLALETAITPARRRQPSLRQSSGLLLPGRRGIRR